MKNFASSSFALIIASLLSSAALAEGTFPPPPQATVVTFSSLGAGIDFDKYTEALSLIAASVSQGAIAQFKQSLWGREGERTLCVIAQSAEDNIRIAQELSKAANPIVNVSFPRGCP